MSNNTNGYFVIFFQLAVYIEYLFVDVNGYLKLFQQNIRKGAGL